MFQKVQHGPAKHKSRCCSSLYWGRSHLVKSKVPGETFGCVHSTGGGSRALKGLREPLKSGGGYLQLWPERLLWGFGSGE